ncbi:MAG: hypothetical protein ABL927_08685 [Bdellovibrionales bacterium]
MIYYILQFAMLITMSVTQAEYRAFELKIENAQGNSSRTVLTILDHLQYPRYYPLAKDEIIAIIDTWMCYENSSDFTPICKKPDNTIATK